MDHNYDLFFPVLKSLCGNPETSRQQTFTIKTSIENGGYRQKLKVLRKKVCPTHNNNNNNNDNDNNNNYNNSYNNNNDNNNNNNNNNNMCRTYLFPKNFKFLA